MGGMGSGRFGRRGGRRRVEETRGIDVASVLGDSVPATSPATVTIGFREGDEAEGAVRETRVTLVSAPQPFGGLRWWLVCDRCGKRRQRLFLSLPIRITAAWQQARRDIRPRFGCRVCLRLAYHSQQSGPLRHAEHMAHKLWARAAGLPSDELPSDWIPKPPKKHWRTFDRDYYRAEQYIERVNRAVNRSICSAMMRGR